MIGNVVSIEAQPESGSLMLGGGLGTGLYHGEFNSLQGTFNPILSTSGGLHLQYSISDLFAVGAALSHSGHHYNISDFSRQKYASNFFGPAGAATYPASSVALTGSNDIGTTDFLLYGKFYLAHVISEKFAPFAFAGLGLVSFSPTNDDGEPLPTNLTGVYQTTSLQIPFGGGLEYSLSDKLKLWLEYTYHTGFTDYLDGYAHYLDYETGTIPTGPGTASTQSDHFSTLRVGASYRLFKKEKSPERDPSDIASADPLDPDSETREPMPRTEPATEPTPLEPEPLEPRRTAFPPIGEGDSDSDMVSDVAEVETYGTDPFSRDSDNDGLSDGEEIFQYDTNPLSPDTDDDLLSDESEVRRFGTSPKRSDTDRDELGDNHEIVKSKTDPLVADTDGDGVIDGSDRCPTESGSILNFGCPGDGLEPETNDGLTERHDADLDNASTPLDDEVQPVGMGERTEFENIFFVPNSDDLDFTRPETGENLVRLLDFVQSCDDVGVLIEGHSSSEGDKKWNRRLSQLRAERVRNWLVANGVEPDKILGAVGYGDRMPKIEEPSNSGLSAAALERLREQNRRITALVRKPCQ